MNLTIHQQQQLSADLRHTANIEYDEVYDELYDHFASLVEHDLAGGQTFEIARERAWQDLGAERGIKKIEKNFIQSIRSQIQQQHWAILKSYFRWPTLITTMLVGVLVYSITPLMSNKALLVSLFIINCLPLSILYYHDSSLQKSKSKNPSGILWTYAWHVGGIPINLWIAVTCAFPHLFEIELRSWMQLYTVAASVITFFFLIYGWSCIRLVHEQILTKPSLQS